MASLQRPASTPLLYRPEIDGLRAVAVLPVIVFHAGFLAGGFVGVDVFFVISGYLITSIILKELDQGSFSLANFWERRARRILPALFLVVFACIPIAWFVLPPPDMLSFARSVGSVAIFLSNHFFWSEAGYFDSAVELKPLIHTWSLAVEEQFYLLFPLLFLLFWRVLRPLLLPVLVIGAVASLLLAQWATMNSPRAGFFFLPTRAWELLFGVVLAWLHFYRPGWLQTGPVMASALALAGLGMIAYAMASFDASTPFPGFHALLPVGGTALVIAFAVQGNFVARVLSWKPLVLIGLISYSAYLWHQPLFAFARHVERFTPLAALVLSVLTLALAWLSWLLVEKPLRRRAGGKFNRQRIVQIGVAGSAAMILFGAVGHWSAGFQGRFFPISPDFSDYIVDNSLLREGMWGPLRELTGDPRYGVFHNPADDLLTFSMDPDRRRVLIVGNSHSKDTFNKLAAESGLFPEFEFARFGMTIACMNGFDGDRLFASENFQVAEVVMVSTRWNFRSCSGGMEAYTDFHGVRLLTERAQAQGKLVVFTSSSLEFPEFGNFTLVDRVALRHRELDRLFFWRNSKKLSGDELRTLVNRTHFAYRHDPSVIQTNRDVQALAAELDAVFLDKEEVLCDQDEQLCFGLTSDNQKSFYDYGHYSLQGAKYFGRRAARIDWLGPVREAIGSD